MSTQEVRENRQIKKIKYKSNTKHNTTALLSQTKMYLIMISATF